MPNRISKSKSRSHSTQNRHSRADFIRTFGFKVAPCSRCLDKKIRCFGIDDSNTYAHYCSLGRSCDGSFVPMSSLNRITEELKRLERQEELAEEALIEQQKKLDEALARLMRLRKLRRLLRDRGLKMVRRSVNLKEMEESDRREEESRQAELVRVQNEEAQLLREVQTISGASVSDFSSFNLSAFLASDEIPSEASGNVPNSQ